MRRVGWLVTLSGVVLAVSVWLPWLHTSVNGGGHANAIGGATGSVILPPGFGAGQLILLVAALLMVAGAMVGQNIVRRVAALSASLLALGELGLAGVYYRLNVHAPIAVGYGLWVAVGASVIALIVALVALLSPPEAGVQQRHH